ncbi:MAG: alpha/beta hydrolase [Chthoniobacteraceae bacterium]
MLHTGGWNRGNPDEFRPFSHLLARNGYAVAAIEYRLAPMATWPAQRDDTLTAIRYLKAHSTELGIDPTCFVLLGRSAGGQIAEVVAYTANDPAIRACIAFYAPADLTYAYQFGYESDMLKSPLLLRQLLGGSPTQAAANFDSASSIRWVGQQSPPTLLLHGAPDPLVWAKQSERLDARLTQIGVPHYFVRVPWGTHAFDFNPNGPGGQISEYAVGYFLAAVLKG